MKKEKINEAKQIIADKWVNTPSWVKEVIYAVLDKYGKYIYDYSWTSGSSTEVYPIMVWSEQVDFQVSTNDKRHFTKKSLLKIVERFPQLKGARYFQNDGSCPNELVFYYKEPLR
jgi:hypothetical protein